MKYFLKKTYLDFYGQFKMLQPTGTLFVELGSGDGFIKEVVGGAVTSDIQDFGVDRVFNACKMPFEDGSVDVFFMLNVLHHILDSRAFFKEAVRCLRVGGKIIMIEPANTLWSRFIYKNFHHEDFDIRGGWGFKVNGAIPWIIFNRDRLVFEREFPALKIVSMHNHTPLRYLLSGGLTLPQLVPSFTYPLIEAIEYILRPLNLGMFQTIEIENSGETK